MSNTSPEQSERVSHPLSLPRVDQTSVPFNRPFNAAAVESTPVDGRTQEEMALSMLEDLKRGVISVSSLMGPLCGKSLCSA
jgi:hypothetical protein